MMQRMAPAEAAAVAELDHQAPAVVEQVEIMVEAAAVQVSLNHQEAPLAALALKALSL